MIQRAAFAIPFALVFVAAGTAQAEDPPRPESAETTRGVAMGTGARASAMSTAALLYNPANLGMARLYHIEGNAAYDPGSSIWSLGAAVVDSSSGPLAAGLAFRGLLDAGDSGYSGIDGKLALGLPLSDAIGIGLAGRYVAINRTTQDDEDEEELVSGFTMDASIRVTPVDGFHIAGYAQNLIALDSALAPVIVGGGMSLQIGDSLVMGGDVLADLTTFEHAALTVGGGAEYLAGGSAPVRLGYRYDLEREIHTVTGGIGYVDAQFGVDLAIGRDVVGGDDTDLQVALRYFVE